MGAILGGSVALSRSPVFPVVPVAGGFAVVAVVTGGLAVVVGGSIVPESGQIPAERIQWSVL